MIARNPEPILAYVAAEHGLTVAALLRHDQRRAVALARREAMRRLLAERFPVPEVAAIFTQSEASVRYATRTRRKAADTVFTRGTTQAPADTERLTGAAKGGRPNPEAGATGQRREEKPCAASPTSE